MRSFKSQALYVFGSTCFAAVLQVAQLNVLARRLEAHELGILAIINAILAVAMVLQDMGLSSYIVHRQNITRKEQSTIYWVNVFLSLLAGLLLILLAWPIACFYHIAQLTGLIMLTSLNFLVLGSLSQYQAHFIKAKRVLVLAKIEMATKLVAFLFTVALLYLTSFTVSAVILGLFISAVLRILSMIILGDKSWRPTFEFDKATFFSSIRYGAYQLGSQTINQLRTQADSVIVGKVMGADMLGIYSLAKELVLQPLKLVTPVINRLALPHFAEKQHEPAQLQQLFLKGTFMIMLFSSLMYLAIGIMSPVIVRLLYGSAHETVAQLIPLMLLFGMLRPIGGWTGAIAQANGQTNIEFWWNVAATIIVVLVLATIWLYPNVWYVALTLSVSQVLMSTFVHPFFIKPVIGIRFAPYARQWISVSVVFVGIMGLISYYDLFIRPEWFSGWF
ncbi:oligosaccharide flippase family protein [Erwinia tracheiphila]|uniref:Amylovoran biosynthesis protein AmsL n=1 Tax=Erwinia tracheiphila TaxID=65700 RepID=A0A0M2K852_9GAMM|nr:oligosaccharide flippase family protein [Erwinia tracheiphila]EOS96433.1 exopolysaccharide biosynthesis protein AmsL [Erwinia tracheiphila PSU-1]KKF35114.1 amylovoran biosynthesis protein AmsL [Erwinia tracheiphila]UIA86771.1 oligosaccharide flippase family protein [Erwinia tracheiphila]UIA95127.1 oligosaccharide flippase family protein [Erwinia tracheiphila]